MMSAFDFCGRTFLKGLRRALPTFKNIVPTCGRAHTQTREIFGKFRSKTKRYQLRFRADIQSIPCFISTED